MIKTNIKMRVTPEQSKRVQEICLGNNILWKEGRILATFNDNHYLIIDNKISMYNTLDWFNEISYQEIDADLFIKTNGTCEETYISKYGGTLPKDYNSALKKIENLHIALNKKVAKNKNQALEITKLLEQKKDLQEINDTQNNYIKNLENDLDKLNKSVCANSNVLNDYIRELETKVSELQSNLDYKNECTKQLINDKESLKNEIKIKDKVIKQLIEQINKVNIDIEDTLKLNLDKLKEKDIIISYLESKLK